VFLHLPHSSDARRTSGIAASPRWMNGENRRACSSQNVMKHIFSGASGSRRRQYAVLSLHHVRHWLVVLQEVL
jgi:hypothetical protein